jgi:RNA polymerase sigma-70 factor (ECF subfamily)
VHDHGEAEDLVQDVFIEILRMVHHFDPTKGSAKTWILQYAYHRSLNRRQYLTLRKFYDSQQLSDFTISEPYYSPNGWKHLSFSDWEDTIQQGLAALNDRQRATVEMACFEGLLLKEIAERLNESVENVRHHYYRGLKKLKSFLQEQREKENTSNSPRGES